MATLTIHSQMKNFKLIRHVTLVTPDRMDGGAVFGPSPICDGPECMAQLAALHVRYCLNFNRQAFLLKINRCDLLGQAQSSGEFELTAKLTSQSSQSYAYQVCARGPNKIVLNAELLIGTRPYDNRFKREILKPHYRKIFDDLCNSVVEPNSDTV